MLLIYLIKVSNVVIDFEPKFAHVLFGNHK